MINIFRPADPEPQKDRSSPLVPLLKLSLLAQVALSGCVINSSPVGMTGKNITTITNNGKTLRLETPQNSSTTIRNDETGTVAEVDGRTVLDTRADTDHQKVLAAYEVERQVLRAQKFVQDYPQAAPLTAQDSYQLSFQLHNDTLAEADQGVLNRLQLLVVNTKTGHVAAVGTEKYAQKNAMVPLSISAASLKTLRANDQALVLEVVAYTTENKQFSTDRKLLSINNFVADPQQSIQCFEDEVTGAVLMPLSLEHPRKVTE